MSYLRNQVGHIYITMRELKFRFWDSIAKQMLPVLDSWEVGNLANQAERFPVMQYTGLLDSKGVEIYESDIVKSTTGKWDSGEVMFRNTAFRVHAYILCQLEDIEVIGNIYQDSHLTSK